MVVIDPRYLLSKQTNDLANLEWQFVEDSFPEFCTPYPTGSLTEKLKNEGPEPKPKLVKQCFKTPVPTKARSKRMRTGGRVWSLIESSSSSTSSTSSSSPSSTWLIYPTAAQKVGLIETPQWRTYRKPPFFYLKKIQLKKKEEEEKRNPPSGFRPNPQHSRTGRFNSDWSC
ncbi:hypothetical protein F2P56_000922 [Juglans regia]|uniref:Uncharacterized protein n=1 Tax=Juglans regia TaxID=51240 RepID=A0A834DA29_JUGRE|nr:hypothetical protein F2P56_000922 [Juglans regia]